MMHDSLADHLREHAARPALVTDLPDPPELTQEDIEQLRGQASEWKRAFAERVEGMEVQ